jgi:hypothetical protein
MLTENQQKFLSALEQHLGIISKAAASVNMTRQNHYVWLEGENKEEYKKAFEQVTEDVDDFIEDSLMQRIIEGSDAVLLWVAKTRLHKRGYVEKSEVKNDHGEGGLTFTINKIITKDVRGNEDKE